MLTLNLRNLGPQNTVCNLQRDRISHTTSIYISCMLGDVIGDVSMAEVFSCSGGAFLKTLRGFPQEIHLPAPYFIFITIRILYQRHDYDYRTTRKHNTYYHNDVYNTHRYDM